MKTKISHKLDLGTAITDDTKSSVSIGSTETGDFRKFKSFLSTVMAVTHVGISKKQNLQKLFF
jgi:hypothetical protein